ncbi:OTUD1 [Mytilus coruscus]|uniref:OTUD1 n=1 Tax=Mytilus coruscus TaxID=42192 RepID=A0A6J8BY74_MYTCO|nr:OTUD1 [Mytilus coruscus]
MSVKIKIVSTGSGYQDEIKDKDARRNLYVEENSPQWWKDTGIRFQSVNHAPEGCKKLTKVSLMILIESLQRYYGICPNRPRKKNTTEFSSCFAVPKKPNKRNIVEKILEEEISWEIKSLKVMKQITTWDELLALYDIVISKLPPIPTQLSNKWQGELLKDVHKKYADYIPLSIGERVVYQSTPDGNCIYNAVSLIFYGNETMATTLKLSSVVHMVDDIIPFSKYIVEEFKEDTNMWIQAATRTQKDISTAEEVERCCMIEMIDTVKHPYKDGCIFHLHLLAHLLGRPIQQHCSKDYEQYASINHMVPAVCHLGPYGCHLEECAFLGVGVCAFMHNFNSKESYGWVECTLCGQWVHDKCMQVDAAKYSRKDDFPCGCDIIRNGLVPLKRSVSVVLSAHQIEWSAHYYESLDNLDYDFKAIVKNVNESITLRNDVFRREGHGRMKFLLRCGRFGPFTEDFIDFVNCCLYKIVKQTEHALVPDIYLPEVCSVEDRSREGGSKSFTGRDGVKTEN